MLRGVSEYHRPKQLDEALELLARSDVLTLPISGGSELVAQARRDVEAVVDLQDLGLSTIRSEEDALHVGATTTLQALIDSPDAAAAWGGTLTSVLEYTTARNLREAGTIAGTLVTAESNNPLAVLLLALDASLVIVNRRRESSHTLGGFFGERESMLRRALITEVIIPLPQSGEAVAFEKVSRTPADMPIVCVAIRARIDAGLAHDVRVALGGVGEMPMRIEGVEQALEDQALDQVSIAPINFDQIEVLSDFMGSAEYRREMAGVLVRRAIGQLSAEIKTLR